MGPPSELFVISDLHIGGQYSATPGERGFRINTHVDVLARFLAEVAARGEGGGGRVELVINGDFVDFLAEEVPPGSRRHRSFISDQDEAVATFDALVERDRAVFDALGEVLAAGVTLTVVLGNHDLELSLPAVRARLGAALGADGQRRFGFVYDGEAHVVGSVLIEHGNRYDGWNVVDHDRLRRFRSECSRRLETSSDARFHPPVGSDLVERTMNPIKHDYPFIDLLKPETDAAIPLLVSLEPSLASVATAIETTRLDRKAASHGPVAPARPAQAGDIAGRGRGPAPSPLGSMLARRVSGDTLSELLALVEEAQKEGRASEQEIAGGAAARALSFMRLKLSPSYESRLRILLGTLRGLHGDRSFDRSQETAKEYLDAARALADRGFTTVVFGHTHLAKDVALPGQGRYLNTGTWADLIQVPSEIIVGSAVSALTSLRRFADAIQARQFGDYLIFRPTFAHVRLDARGRAVTAGVRDYEPGVVAAL